MSLLFTQSFDIGGAFSNRTWSTYSGTSITSSVTEVKTGTYSGIASSSDTYYGVYDKGSAIANSKIFIQFHVYFDYRHINNDLISFYNISNVLQSSWTITGKRQLQFKRGSTILGTSDFKIDEDVWHYIEIEMTISNSISTNDCIIKVDGNEVLNLAATTDTADSADETLRYVRFHHAGTYTRLYYDNIIMMDNQSGYNDSLAGEAFVEMRVPNASGNYSEFSTSGGTNYLMVDDIGNVDNDTTYVESGIVDERDSYEYEDISESSVTILGVNLKSRTRSTSFANQRDFRHFARIGSTNYDGPAITETNTTWSWYENKIWDESPATSVAWTQSEFDAAEFGVKIEV